MFSCLRRTFCCSSKKTIQKQNNGTYVLKLADDKYYVGESNDIERRIWMHKNENGSAWTKQYEVENQRQIIASLDNIKDQLNFSFQKDLKDEQDAFNYFMN